MQLAVNVEVVCKALPAMVTVRQPGGGNTEEQMAQTCGSAQHALRHGDELDHGVQGQGDGEEREAWGHTQAQPPWWATSRKTQALHSRPDEQGGAEPT